MIKSRLAVVTVIAYLGLAIVGAGGPGRFFSYPPLTAVTLVTIALGVAGLFSEGHIGAGVKEDRSNRWVIAALGVLGVLGAYLPAYTDRIDFLTVGGEGVRWLGVLLYAAGGVLRLAPVFGLGRRFSGLVAIQPELAVLTLPVVLARIEITFSRGEDVREAQLASLLYLCLQLVPAHVSIAQARRILTLPLELLFHLLGLHIEVRDMILNAGRIIEDEQPVARKVVQNRRLAVQVGDVEGDVFERTLLSQFFQIVLPSLLGVPMERADIELLQFSNGLGSAKRNGLACRTDRAIVDGIERALRLLVKGAQ